MTRRTMLQAAFAGQLVSYSVETIRSSRQATDNYLRVVRGDGKRTLLVLPVVAGMTAQWGDGFYETLRLGVADKYGMDVAAVTFSHLPWYADHPANAKIAQESFLLDDVLPRLRGEILLVGFSKSGFGALSMLLRHPERFRAAAVFDAPLLMAEPGKYGSGEIYGTKKNFEGYAIGGLLERRAATMAGSGERVALLGYDNFRADMAGAHDLMERLGIRHRYENSVRRAHHWGSGWMEEAVSSLDSFSRRGA